MSYLQRYTSLNLDSSLLLFRLSILQLCHRCRPIIPIQPPIPLWSFDFQNGPYKPFSSPLHYSILTCLPHFCSQIVEINDLLNSSLSMSFPFLQGSWIFSKPLYSGGKCFPIFECHCPSLATEGCNCVCRISNENDFA